MEVIVAFAIGIIVLALLAKLISLPLRLVGKLITDSIIGAIRLWVVNLFGAGIHIGFLKALIAGIFGIPGVIVLLILAHI